MDDALKRSPEMHLLYLLRFSSGKNYVGQTVRALKTRMNQHRTASNRGSKLPVHCAWRVHGEPTVEVLGEFDTHEELHRAEIEAIKAMGTLAPAGYNVGFGGETAPSKNPAVAQKIAERARGRKIADTTHLSEAVRQRWMDPVARERMTAGARAVWTEEKRADHGAKSKAVWERRKAEGWHMPEEQRAQLKGREFSEETRSKMSAAAKRRGISKEQRRRMADAQRDLARAPHSEQRIKNMSAGIKAAWADPVKRERLIAARKAAWETRRRQQQEFAQ